MNPVYRPLVVTRFSRMPMKLAEEMDRLVVSLISSNPSVLADACRLVAISLPNCLQVSGGAQARSTLHAANDPL